MTGQHAPAEFSDTTGLEILEIFAHAEKFNAWLFDEIAPYCRNNLLEIGSGIGNISKLLLKYFNDVSLSDLRTEYCEILKQKFAGDPHLNGIHQINLAEPEFEKKFAYLQNRFDTVIASNVVEHIEDDQLSIRNCKYMLQSGGRLVVLVPAYNQLYNSFDKELGHFRRYNKKGLQRLLTYEGFEIVHSGYFNFTGIFGWWVFGSLFKKKIIPKSQLALYNKLIVIARLVDKIIMHRAGLSAIVIGAKK